MKLNPSNNTLRLKDQKKILIISRSFYPMNSPRSFRTTELVKEFLPKGQVFDNLELKYKADDRFCKYFRNNFSSIISSYGFNLEKVLR